MRASVEMRLRPLRKLIFHTEWHRNECHYYYFFISRSTYVAPCAKFNRKQGRLNNFLQFHQSIIRQFKKVRFQIALEMFTDYAALTDSGSALQAAGPPTPTERSQNFPWSPE